MKGLKKGPELKMPELKVPAVFSDLYYDLRDRRLLPLVGLVLVAIVATPFLLSQGGTEEEEIPVPPAIQALKESGGHPTSSLTVVAANPGLRDYRKRLGHRTPLDPFRSFGKPSLKGAQLGGGEEGGGGKGSSSVGTSADFTSTSTTVTKTHSQHKTTKTETTTTTTNGAGKGKGESGGGGSREGAAEPVYTIDVEISIAGQVGVSVQPLQRTNVLPLTALPDEEIPVVTYLGPGSGGTKALFSVSKEVTGVYGEAECVSGTETCEAVELEPNFPVTFVYGPDQDRYRIKLLKISKVGGSHS